MKAAEPETWTDEELAKTLTYPAGKPNIFRRGQQIYGAEGCASCHTQMIRPTFMTFESYRPDFGKEGTIEAPKRIRETRPADYAGEEYAFLGVQRIGPDLSNVGYRHDEAWHHLHLYNPRAVRGYSNMPSFRHLYKKQKIRGQRSADALELTGEFDPGEGIEVVPTESARTLVDYLMTLKKDDVLPPAADAPEAGAGVVTN
jgi:cytochrome c oxidase cbb3-type subunit 2